MSNKKQNGFSLIELMIVVAVVAILAAIAYPSYQSEIRKSHRTDAEGALMGLANAMERYFTENGRYVDASNNPPSLGSGGIYPNQSPTDGGTAFYTLSIDAASTDKTAYLLKATPVAGTIQASDECGTLTLDSTGARGAAKTDCWKR